MNMSNMSHECKHRFFSKNGAHVSSFLSAVSAAPGALERVLHERGLGEQPTGCRVPPAPPLAAAIRTGGITLDSLWQAVSLAHLAVKSDACSLDDAFGREGLVAWMLERLLFPDSPLTAPLEDIVELARAIERAIPGYPVEHPERAV